MIVERLQSYVKDGLIESKYLPILRSAMNILTGAGLARMNLTSSVSRKSYEFLMEYSKMVIHSRTKYFSKQIFLLSKVYVAPEINNKKFSFRTSTNCSQASTNPNEEFLEEYKRVFNTTENITTSPLIDTKVITEDYPDYIDEGGEKYLHTISKLDNVNHKLFLKNFCNR